MDYVPYVDFDDSFGTYTYDELLEKLKAHILIVYTMVIVACITHNMFNLNKLDKCGQQMWTTIGNYGRTQPNVRGTCIVQGFD